jgi:hypothetical protein
MMRKLLTLVLLPALLLQWFPDTLHTIWHDDHHQHTIDFATAEDCLSEAHVHCDHDQVLWMPAEPHESIPFRWITYIYTNSYLTLETSAVHSEPLSIKGRAPPEMI